MLQKFFPDNIIVHLAASQQGKWLLSEIVSMDKYTARVAIIAADMSVPDSTRFSRLLSCLSTIAKCFLTLVCYVLPVACCNLVLREEL